MVHECLPEPECWAPRYAAAHCRRCGSASSLKFVHGDFECSDRTGCAAWAKAQARKRRKRARR